MLVIELPPLLDENGLKDLSALVMVHQVGLPDPDIRLDWSGCTSWAACTGQSTATQAFTNISSSLNPFLFLLHQASASFLSPHTPLLSSSPCRVE